MGLNYLGELFFRVLKLFCFHICLSFNFDFCLDLSFFFLPLHWGLLPHSFVLRTRNYKRRYGVFCIRYCDCGGVQQRIGSNESAGFFSSI